MEWYVLALASALFSAVAAILEKKILFKEKVLGFVALLAIFNLVLAVPFFFFVNYNEVSTNGLLVLFIKTILEAASFFCVMYGIKKLELSEALPLLVLVPGLVAIVSFIFLGEALTNIEILGLILLMMGTYVLQLKSKQDLIYPFKRFIQSKGHRFIILALILFTISSVLDKAILKNFSMPPNAFISFQYLFMAIMFLSLILFSGKIKEIKSPFRNSWLWILILSAVTIAYRYPQILATKDAPVALVVALKRISVFFAAVIGGTIFKERGLIRKAIATAIMVAGAILVAI